MNNTLKLAGAFLALALVNAAQAVSINGRIDIGANNSTVSINTMTNSVAFTGGVVNPVTMQNFNASVTLATGDYSAFAPTFGSQTNANYFNFNYTTPFAPVGQKIWEVNAGTYFRLNSLTGLGETEDSLSLTGLGTAYLTGKDATPGLWSFSADRNTNATTFTFSSTTQVPPPSVPESGASIALLGSALVAMGLISRRRRA